MSTDLPSRSGARRIDLAAWVALAWVVGFGMLYAEMILRVRAPGLMALLRRMLYRG